MNVLAVLWLFPLCLLVLAGWVMTLFTLPGNWLILATAIVFAWVVPAKSGLDFGWPAVVALAVLATLGEIVEFAAGAMGVAKSGGSKRSGVLAVLGSLAGAMIGAVVGIPIPVVGSIVGIVLFAGLGALAGAMLGESWKGKKLGESWKTGQAAFWGRLLGSVAKIVIATIMAVLTLAAAIL